MSIADFKSVIIEEENNREFNKQKVEDSLDIVFSRIFVLSDNVESTKYLILQKGYIETINKMNNTLIVIDNEFKDSERITKKIKLLTDELRKESNKIANFADHAETYQRTIALTDFLKKRDTLRYLLVITWLLTIPMRLYISIYKEYKKCS